MSPSPSPSSPSSLAHGNLAFIAWLPAEVLLNVFSYLDEPLQLYHASLTCRVWRSAALDSRLWEPIYWRFYRGGGNRQDEDLAQRRENFRRGCMRAWLHKTIASSLPTDFMRSFLSRDPVSGDLVIHRSLMKTMLAFIEMLGDDHREEVIFQLVYFAMLEWSDHRPVDPDIGAQMIHDHLKKVFGRSPPPRDFIVATVLSQNVTRQLARSCNIEPSTASFPPFLDRQVEGQGAPRRRRQPNFHDLFVSRMNSDESILQHLDEQSRLTTGKLDRMLRLIDQHGDGARDILFALIATQQVTSETVGVFAADIAAQNETKLRALDVHGGATAGSACLLSRRNCLGLYNAAQQLLGHLQRREAVQSIRRLRSRWAHCSTLGNHSITTQALRKQVVERCAGIEEALATLALFRYGEKSEISAYLDLLALHVWANLQTAKGALDNLRKKGSSPPGDSPEDEQTTRHTLKEVHRVIRSLGFGLAYDESFYDLHNSFIHVPLWCPARREGDSVVQTAIFCAVARRIGIAATLIDTPNTFMALIIEDGPQPAAWRDDDEKEWRRFCYLPNNDELSSVLEIGDVKRWVAEYGQPEQDDVQSILQPCSPLAILERVTLCLQGARQREREAQPQPEVEDSAITGTNAAGVKDSDSPAPVAAAARDDLGALCSFLMSRPSTPPCPLPPGVLPSSLAMLPQGTRAASTRSLQKDVELASFWVFRIVQPSIVHGAQRGDAMFAKIFFGHNAGHDHYHCDAALLLDVNDLDVAQELNRARDTAKRRGEAALYRLDADAPEEGSFSSGDEARGLSSRSQLRCFAAQLFALDWQASTGVGGVGGARPSKGHVSRDPNTRMMLDRSHPSNARVELRVGTVFKHRVHGWHGVVVGWDSTCRASRGWFEANQVDSLPSGGRNQPFYHVIVMEDESRRYIAQCNLEPLRIPAGATPDEAQAILRKLVPLFSSRCVGKSFRTVRVAPWKKGKGKEGGVAGQEGGEVTLVMNEWMTEAWPFD